MNKLLTVLFFAAAAIILGVIVTMLIIKPAYALTDGELKESWELVHFAPTIAALILAMIVLHGIFKNRRVNQLPVVLDDEVPVYRQWECELCGKEFLVDQLTDLETISGTIIVSGLCPHCGGDHVAALTRRQQVYVAVSKNNERVRQLSNNTETARFEF